MVFRDYLILDPSFSVVSITGNRLACFKLNTIEQNFQKYLDKKKHKIEKKILFLLISFQVLFLLADLQQLNISTVLRILGVLGLVGMSVIDLFSNANKRKVRAGVNPTRKQPKQSFDFNITSETVEVGLLITTQEISALMHLDNIYYWMISLLLSVAVHLMSTKNFHADKKWVFGRVALQILLAIYEGIFVSWKLGLILLLRALTTYVCLLNIQLKVNLELRTYFTSDSSDQKWTDQLHSTIDEIPYPLFILDLKDAQSETKSIQTKRFVKIGFFNLYADQIINLVEEDECINFLDLISDEDEMTFIDESYRIAQNEVPKTIFCTELNKSLSDRVTSSVIFSKFDITIWKCRWRDEEAIAVKIGRAHV